MKRRTRTAKRLKSSDSEDDSKNKTEIKTKTPPKKIKGDDDSSSDSDIENYLQPINKLDFNSSFFNMSKETESTSFDNIEKAILGESSRLTSSSESEVEDDPKSLQISSTQLEEADKISKMNYKQFQEYTDTLEQAKQHIDQYKAKKQAEAENVDIFSMLISTEGSKDIDNQKSQDFHSSDFESCSDSEKEGWEEVKTKEQQEKSAPKEGLQITVEMPGVIKNKKNKDLLAAMKRRLNRIRKENQVLVHKVHLLCWIAHGNYLNSVLNNEKTLSLALSLLPSEKCYPSDRIDLKYLEQIVRWYRTALKLSEAKKPSWYNENEPLNEILAKSIENKEVYNKKLFVYIFIAMLRALGVQCRLVLSFQVEPLRPPASELCSLSTKVDKEKPKKAKVDSKKSEDASKPTTSKDQSKTKTTSKESKTKSKATVNVKEVKVSSKQSKTTSKETKANTRKPKDSKTDSKDDVKTNIRNNSKENKSEPPKQNKRNPEQTVESPSSKPKLNKLSQRTSVKITKMDLSSNNTQTEESSKQNSTDKTAKSNSTPNLKRLTRQTSTKSSQPKNPLKQDTTKEKRPAEDNKTSSKKRAKSTSDLEKPKDEAKTRSKSTTARTTRNNNTIKVKLPPVKKNNNSLTVPQVDGAYDSTDDEMIPQLDGTTDDKEEKPKANLRSLRSKTSIKVAKPVAKYKDTDSEEEFEGTPSQSPQKKVQNKSSSLEKSKYFGKDIKEDIVKLVKGRIKEQKILDNSRKVKRKSAKLKEESDSDYAPEPIAKKEHDSEDEFVPKVKVKQRVNPKRKVLSSDEEEDVKKKKKPGTDIWCEVFLENEEKWMSVDLFFGKVHCDQEIYNRATHPLSYVVAWDNSNKIKDVTRRYCQNFNTITRKLRINKEWWDKTLKPFVGVPTARDREEDDELERQQLEKPLPTSIAEFKNHPLYVLKRHLLKFEAIYPPDAPTLGFIRNEPVYSRQCVYTLHSRDIWLKQAKVVKPGEEPYKIVKARPKYDRLSNTFITDQMLEIFGPWQTQDYEPPTAENGIVPRNAYGNVELFKPSMLPKKTVHLQLPGLNKIARRMNIDCATAIVGFDFHGGWSHPTYDGFVVCEEYADQLIAAWELEQEELEKKEQEKLEKRVYGNWKKLIKGLLIRERLKKKYDFGPPPSTSDEKEKKKPRLLKKYPSDSESGSYSDSYTDCSD